MQHPSRSILFLLLLSLVILAAPAAADTAGTPLLANELAIRQAHMDLVSYTREVEMNAAITYIYPLRMTDTARLNALLAEYRAEEAKIKSASTMEEFENITRSMRAITEEFRTGMNLQMEKGYGKPNDLAIAVHGATINNPYIEQRKAAYWTARKTGQLADFDAYVRESQASLDTLKAGGFPVAPAQRTLDVLASKRPVLVAALDARSEERIAAAGDVILPLSVDLGTQAEGAQGEVSEAERMQFYIDQGYRIVSRADALNLELTKILLDIGPAETATRSLKQDLSIARRYLDTGSIGLARNPMTMIKKDLKDLSMDYRAIANSADLPPELTATLRTLVITIDNAADAMEGY